MSAQDTDQESGKKTHIPANNHPWRNYKDKKVPVSTPKKVNSLKPLKLILMEIVENWETLELEVETKNGLEKRFITEVSTEKSAKFILGFLRPYLGDGKGLDYGIDK